MPGQTSGAHCGALSGASCDVCVDQYWGSDCKGECKKCEKDRGMCNDGLAGNGNCTCIVAHVWGELCENDCPGGRNNSCCGNGQCDEGSTGSGLCTCATNFWGEDCCQECPRSFGNGQVCNGHGTCSDGRLGDGQCTCDIRLMARVVDVWVVTCFLIVYFLHKAAFAVRQLLRNFGVSLLPISVRSPFTQQPYA